MSSGSDSRSIALAVADTDTLASMDQGIEIMDQWIEQTRQSLIALKRRRNERLPVARIPPEV